MAKIPHKILISEQFDDVRIDNFLTKEFSLPKNLIYKELRKGRIKVNKKKKIYSYRLKKGDEIVIYGNYEQTIKDTKSINENYIERFKDSIIFEDEKFIVINKWPGISSQSGSGVTISIDDIASQIKYNGKRLHLVHRLDKDTSGLMILALDIKTSRFFLELFTNHQIKKTYYAIVQSNKNLSGKGKIKTPIVDKDQEFQAETDYKVIKNINNNLYFIRLNPKTGRKHQLRIHCTKNNFPILGDKKYYIKELKNKKNEKNLFLHAGEIEFINYDKSLVKFKADLPKHFQKYIMV
jgi:23S rRNA pseudouridine955/2504/2580 synthase|tara:strand:- start:3961 stop:4842 length:882 start_codon:yes stop_codon:yes gene_type:complete